jgi:DNA-binding transcriptional MerR regulator
LEKAPDAFRTISEVAEELDVPQHVLRFWESRFPQIRPMKRAGGRRYYRPDDVDLLRGIRHLLYGVGYTIRGVQGILREKGSKFVQQAWQTGTAPTLADPAQSQTGAEQLAPDEAARAMFGLLKAPEAAAAMEMSSTTPIFTPEQVRRLQSALQELTECRQLIDDALKDEAA